MIAQVVKYRTQQRHKLTWQDYYDFLQRTKRKLYKEPNRIEQVGHYLRVIDEGNIAEDNYYG
jgi:MOSC domain-containing protein YiiM